jgi:hypothetical protein
MTEDTRAQSWQRQDLFATTLLCLFIDEFGTDGLAWAPATIRHEIQDSYGVSLTDVVFSRLMAGIVVLTSDAFFTQLPDFAQLCNVLSGDGYDPASFQAPDAVDIAWGITEALLLSPPELNKDHVFDDEIRYFIGHVLQQEGMVEPPDVLKFALFDQPAARVALDVAAQAESQFKAQAIQTQLRERLTRLFAQVSELSLTTGKTRDVLQKVNNELHASA